MGGDALEGARFGREIDAERSGGEDDPALEPAARRRLAVRNHVEAEEDGEPDERHAEGADGVARRRRRAPGLPVLALRLLLRIVLLLLDLAEEERCSSHRDEEDELLAHGVEGAVVEVHRAHHVRRLALADGERIEHLAVRTRVRAEWGQPRKAPDQEGRESGGSRGDEEGPHFRSSSPACFRSSSCA